MLGQNGSNIPDEIEVSRRDETRVREEGANKWEDTGRKANGSPEDTGCDSAMQSLSIRHATGCESVGNVKWVKEEPGSNRKFSKTRETR